MTIELRFAELHTPLFISLGKGETGKNLGLKLDPYKDQALSLQYDRENKELLVTWKGAQAIVPISNVATMIAGVVVSSTTTPPAAKASPPVNAQVSTPTSHVQEGPGRGKK